jgi:YD repeat-containing protein
MKCGGKMFTITFKRIAVVLMAFCCLLTVPTLAQSARVTEDSTALHRHYASHRSVSSGAAPQSNVPQPHFSYVTFDVPTATATEVRGINDRGDTVGIYDDASGIRHGFSRDRKGKLATIDVPGAGSTRTNQVNNLEEIAGAYTSTDNVTHGFVIINSKTIRLDFPGATSTSSAGLNDKTEVVGRTTDATGAEHGYVWRNGKSPS